MTNATGHRKPQPLRHYMCLGAGELRGRGAAGLPRRGDQQDAVRCGCPSIWNTGAIKRATWVKHFRAGNIAAARRAMMNWKSPPEIEDRRKEERALFFDGVLVQ